MALAQAIDLPWLPTNCSVIEYLEARGSDGMARANTA